MVSILVQVLFVQFQLVPHSPPKLHQQRGMELRRFALVALLASASAFQLRPCAGRTAAARPALAQPPRILLAEEGNELPSLPSPFAVSDSLIQFSTLSDDYKKVRAPHREASPPRHSRPLQRVPCPPIPAQVVLAALEQSNKGRILSGMPVYPSVEGMVESYMEYEGTEKGMSLLEAEDEVVRYLQRKAVRRVEERLSWWRHGSLALVCAGPGSSGCWLRCALGTSR